MKRSSLILAGCVLLSAGCTSVMTKSTVTATTVSNPVVGFSGMNFPVPPEWHLVAQDPLKSTLTHANLAAYESVENLSRAASGINPAERILWDSPFGSVCFSRFFVVRGRDPLFESELRYIAEALITQSRRDPRAVQKIVPVGKNFAGVVKYYDVQNAGPKAVIIQWHMYVKPGSIIALSFVGLATRETEIDREFSAIMNSLK